MVMKIETEIKSMNGGKRPNAGRKFGTGKFGEPTTVVRIPTSQKSVILDFLSVYERKRELKDRVDMSTLELPVVHPMSISIPLFNSKVPAGFPSPADDHVEKRLDPTEFLIDQADATFFVTIQGESMIDIGLMPGDKAVVDRSKIASVGDVVLAVVDGDFTIKLLSHKKNGHPKLLPANSTGKYQPIEIKEDMQFEVWGVVTGSFRRFR
jgi:DNA polymerase V